MRENGKAVKVAFWVVKKGLVNLKKNNIILCVKTIADDGFSDIKKGSR